MKKLTALKMALQKAAAKTTSKVINKTQAEKLQEGLREDLANANQNLVAAAIKLHRFIAGRGWIPLGYDSLVEWREKEIPIGEFHNLRNANRLLAEGVSEEAVGAMKLTNIATLVKELPRSAWKDPEWHKKATEMKVADFEAHARAEATKAGTVTEIVERRGFFGPKSLIDQWDLAMKVATVVDGAAHMDEKIEAVLACYLNSEAGVDGKTKLRRYQEITEIGETEL